jgi:hypothetical protein
MGSDTVSHNVTVITSTYDCLIFLHSFPLIVALDKILPFGKTYIFEELSVCMQKLKDAILSLLCCYVWIRVNSSR